MNKVVFTILILISVPALSKGYYSGLFITNNQGAEYADTLILCDSGKLVLLSGGERYKKLVESYFNRQDLSEYGELYVELLLSSYKKVDKILYPKSHYDIVAHVEDVTYETGDKEKINECRKNS